MREIDQVVASFRESGLKITPQRVSIFRLLKDNHSHPSAEDVYRQVLSTHPSISFTTVYKTLQTLRDMGEIQEITIDPERTHYDPETVWHVHTFCKDCRAICDLPMDGKGGPSTFLPDADPFEVHNIQVNLVGLCGECQ